MGEVSIGSFREGFEASTHIWSCEDYQKHWCRQIRRALEGSNVCFITDWRVDYSIDEENVDEDIMWGEMWVLYWLSPTKAAFQNMLILSPVPPDNPDAIDPGERETVNEDGDQISEWYASRQEIEKWMASLV